MYQCILITNGYGNVTVGRISDSPKKSVPQRGIEPRSPAFRASVLTARPPRQLTVTFTPPRRKHVLMRFELGDHIGHQMSQWVELATV